jgi:hypothetical protein
MVFNIHIYKLSISSGTEMLQKDYYLERERERERGREINNSSKLLKTSLRTRK